MEPAHSIIAKLGGPSVVARYVGVHRTRVSNWQRPRAAGGTDGRIPQKHIRALMQLAAEQGVDLPASAFFPPPSNSTEAAA